MQQPTAAPKKSILDMIEWLGNKLPEPPLLFASLAAIVVALSALGTSLGWQVETVRPTVQMVPKLNAAGEAEVDAEGKTVTVPRLDERGFPVVSLEKTGERIQPRSLLTGEGLYWMLSSMLRNFTALPALGLIFVGMLGIGVAEKFGLFSALMRVVALHTPRWALTPMIVFIGANSSVASDAGYIILPPLAAALYAAIGRSPIAGMAAAFCGVAGGFGGGFFPTAGDNFLAGVATQAAHIIDPKYPDVLATHNLYFKSGSAIVVMLAGWFVTDRIVEPRLKREIGVHKGDTSAIGDMGLTGSESRGLWLSLLAMVAIVGAFAWMVMTPGLPLHGEGTPTLANGRVVTHEQIRIVDQATYEASPRDRRLFAEAPETDDEGKALGAGYYVVSGNAAPSLVERPGDRWSQVIVPLIFLAFLVPGCVFGFVTGKLRSQKDFIEAMYAGIRSLVPVLVIMFFLGQFVNYFQYTRLDQMLAYAGGTVLVRADLPIPLLITLFVLLVVLGDFAMSGMLSKFGVMAPIFIPMFMMVGISPELTTAAYRIGDSVVNVITPLNSYLLIILAVYQKYKTSAGLGNLISLMLPYSVLLGIAWIGFLILWYLSGNPLGTQAPLHYVPAPG
jgi:aminobenzoyl-glutamate transport protein